MSNNEIVQKLWNLCDVLRDDGINYSDYVTELVLLLFIKMEHENAQGIASPMQSRAAVSIAMPGGCCFRMLDACCIGCKHSHELYLQWDASEQLILEKFCSSGWVGASGPG